ncbi:MAG TPA: inorganic phosphate transporter [archaeon]|nr:inorganic phosphate transporter [archaeon]
MLLPAILLILTFAAVALVSGNNLSACVGPAVGSKILSQRSGILLGAAGFSLGLLVQGPTMISSIHVLLPNPTTQLQIEALLVAILIFVIAYKIRVPMSLSMSLVGLLAGLSVARKMPISNPFLTDVVIMWLVAPIVAIVSAFYFIKMINKTWPRDIWRRINIYRILIIVLSFTTAYVLGANTLGLIVATGGFSSSSLIVAIAAILVGSFYLSAGEIRRVSEELFLMRYPNATATLSISTLLVEFATIFKIPLSNTQTSASAVFGTGISYKSKYITLKPFMIIVLGWIIAPLISFAIGLII